jgi:ABC-type Fe3+/spermidine/putrescine transport system ATPase subunit
LQEKGDLLVVKTRLGILHALNGVVGLAAGDPVICSLRPESVRVKPAEELANVTLSERMNQFTGEIQSIMYLGYSEQYSLRVADGALVHAVEHNPGTRRVEIGDRVAAQIDARDVIVLPQEELLD